MKKVLKKFNRTLSIMLAAAMVLTMVPQTAMPVLAEEANQIEAQAETEAEVVNEDNKDTTKDIADDEESTDVGETENPVNSGVSEPTEGEAEGAEDDNETPVIEEEGDSDDESEAVEADKIEDSEESETDVVDEAEAAEIGKASADNSTVDSLVPTELTIKAVEPDTEGAEAGATKDLASAEITYTNGCVSGGKIRKDADITFKLDPKAGKKLGTVQYKTRGTAEDATESAARNVALEGDTYTIPKSELMHNVTVDGKTEQVNDVHVTIVVSTVDIAYTLKAGTDTGYKLYLTKADANDSTKTVIDTAKEITSAGLTDKIKYAQKGDKVSFAVVAEGSTAAKIRSVKVQAGDGTEKTIESEADTNDAKPAPIYEFTPSELEDIADNDDQDITIMVEATALATITLDTTGVGEGATLTEVANAASKYEENSFVQAGGDDAAYYAAEGQKVIFAVKMDGAYKDLVADDVTATLGEETIAVTAVTAEGTGAATVPAHYMIDLAGATEAAILSIKISTELKDTANKVTFETVSGNGIIKEASKDVVLNDKTVKVKGDTYSFDVFAEPGYVIREVKASYTRKYTAQEGKTNPDKAVTEDLAKDFMTDEGLASLTGIGVNFSGTETIDDTEWTWTTTDVTVSVKADLKAVTEDKHVYFYFNDDLPFDYEVTLGDKVEEAEDGYGYTVKAGAELFEFTVDAITEPVVVARNDDGVSILNGEPKKTDDGYTYQILAGALEYYQYIYIEHQSFDITVNYDRVNVNAEVYASGIPEGEQPMEADEEDENTDIYRANAADGTHKIIIEPNNDNTKISKVSYTVGDSETPVEVTGRGGFYTFEVELTGDVNVTVETKDEYDLVVTEEKVVVTPDKSGVYNVGHASTVTAELLKGEARMPLFTADVKDGSSVAATIARVEDDAVTLEFDASEYNKVLTVELTLNDKSRTKKTFKVKTTAAATEVSLAGVKNGKVELPVDTQAKYKLTVKDKNAGLDGIGVKVVPADDAKKTDAVSITAANNAVGASIDEDGNLVITAKPAMTGAADVAKVILVDESGLSDEQKAALNVDNALKGGVVTVTTTDATIVGKAPTVSLVTTTDKEIKVKLGVPKEVVDPIEGKIFYKVELAVPQSPAFPEGVTEAQKAAITAALTAAANDWNTNKLYQAKEDIDEDGGLLEIPVMQFTDVNVSNGLDKGVLLEGFSVKATLLQTTGRGEDFLPSNAAKTIVGGETLLENIATKNPYYEVKLGLKKGTTTLITGQAKDIVVATPNFNKLTSYNRVKVEFVNTSTGEPIGGDASWDDGENDNNVEYDANYYGLYARYDELQNAVIVNAVDAWYENCDEYKNLGVKVTAYAEDSAYGAVATQKLTVVNGIQTINPAAPLEIYKGDKAVSFTVTTDLNNVSRNKKYAPKSKKLDYKIVAAEYADELPAAIRENVTVKNGKVTINKNYVVAPRADANRFRVMVIAVDYPDSEVIEYTEDITITGEPLKMGTIAVFDVSGGAYDAKLAAVNDGALMATNKSDEYRVAVLAPGVKTNKKSYNLRSSDVMDSRLFTFKSSNAKSVAVDEYGDLTILKAAKNVKITATPKDGSKQDKKNITLNLKTVGQVAATPYLEITRYQASTLDERATVTMHDEGAPKEDLHYNGNSTNNYFELTIVKEGEKDDEGNVTEYVPYYLANYSISYRGAKQVKKTTNDAGDSITIVANAKETTITLKDKTKRGDKGVTYKLVNDTFVDSKNAAAPKIATSAKLTQDTGIRNVSYTVKGKKTDDFTDKYVMLTVDQTKKNPADIESVFWGAQRELDRPLPIILGEGFNLQVDTDCGVGNYNLVATVGTLEDGVFKPEYKDAKLVVKIAKAKAPNLTAKGNYTLSMKNQSGVYINYTSGNGWANYTGSDGSDEDYYTRNYAKNAIIDGQENRFTDYFEARYDRNDRMYITLKNLPEVAPEGKNDPALSDITGNDAAAKNNRIGYISINNGYKYIDVKLTITLKDCTTDKTKYKVTAAPVVAGEKSVSALTIMDGKSKANVETMIAYSEETGSSGNGLFKPEFDEDGNWYLTAQAATEKKNYPVTLYMVPANAPQAYKDAVEKASGDKAAKQAVYETYCIKATVTVKASDKATTKNKVVVTNKGNNTWNVADTDYMPNTGWSRWTPVSFKSNLGLAANKEIAVAASVNGKEAKYVSFDLTDKKYLTYVEKTFEDGSKATYINLPKSYGMDINLNRDELVKAIEANKAATGAAKIKNFDWGKTISVKATFTYGEGGPKEDELTFKIKLPAAGADDAAVKEALNDAFTDALQSNIETYTKQLRDDYYYDDDINYMVEDYIRSEINKKIKGANVTVEISNDVEDGETRIASIWNVTVRATDAEKTVLYTHEFKLVELLNVWGIINAITEKLQYTSGTQGSNAIVDKDGEVLLKVTSTTTGTEYADAVRKLLEEELGKRGSRNIALTAGRKFGDMDKKSLTFTLRAKDMMKSPSDFNYSKPYTQNITYKLADKQKEDLDGLIKGYLAKYADEIEAVEGIQKAEYKEGVTENVFTVTVGPDAELENDVEAAFDNWREDNADRIDEKRHNLAVALTNTFGEDWEEVDSITAEVTVTVTNSKTEKRTITKNEGETIEEFADRYYDELLAQEDRIRDKCHEMLKEHGMDKVVFRQLRAVTGKALVTVNYKDGSGVSEMFKITVN